MNKLLAYLRLFRLPNVFTAMADIAAGYVFVRGDLQPLLPFACLVVASSLLYTAGMVLNDVFDFEQDKRERPERPLPSGAIPRGWAMMLGWQLLFWGVLLAGVAGFLPTGDHSPALPWRSGAVALLLAVCIVAYDAYMKRTPAGPLFMGTCRFFNLLLGMSLAGGQLPASWTLGFSGGELLVAAGIGVFIAGVTWFARTEAKQSSSTQLSLALGVMLAGIGMVAAYGWLPGLFWGHHFHALSPGTWQLLILMLSLTLAYRGVMAITNPIPQQVQIAVKQAIMSLVVFDAAICLVAAPQGAYIGIGVLCLLGPMLLLGKWVYST